MTHDEWYRSLSPEDLFVDHTFFPDERDVHTIRRHCFACGYIAAIEYDDELQAWVWHTLYKNGTVKFRKQIADRFPPRSTKIEK